MALVHGVVPARSRPSVTSRAIRAQVRPQSHSARKCWRFSLMLAGEIRAAAATSRTGQPQLWPSMQKVDAEEGACGQAGFPLGLTTPGPAWKAPAVKRQALLTNVQCFKN